MKKIILAVVLTLVPTALFAETLEQEATKNCSEFIRIKKECYYKAVKGILPVNGLKGIKSKAPKELVEMSCREGFDAFGRAGKLKANVVNQGMQASFTQCYDSYVGKGSCSELMSTMRNAKTEMEAYYADYQAYPTVVPNMHQLAINGIKLSMTGGGQSYRITGNHPKCNTEYASTNEVPEVKPASEVPELNEQ